MVLRCSLFLAASLLLASFGTAQSSILLKSGDAVTCTVLSDDGSVVKVRRFSDGKELTYRYDELHPRTVYRLMAGRTGRDDARGQMKVAAYALDHGFFDHARRHYRAAVRADERLGGEIEEELKKLRDRGARTVFAWAKQHIGDGEHLEAERWLALILKKFPDTEMATEAARLLQEHAARTMAARQKKVESRAPAVSAASERKLAAAKKHYEKAHELVRKGLTEAKSDVQARRTLERALGEFAKVRKTLDAVAGSLDANDPLGDRIEAHQVVLTADIIETHLHVGSIELFRGSLVAARRSARAALALDRKNADAKALLGRIELAANENNRNRRGRR